MAASVTSDPIARELERGETVVWREQPPARLIVLSKIPALVALGLFVLGFATWVSAGAGWIYRDWSGASFGERGGMAMMEGMGSFFLTVLGIGFIALVRDMLRSGETHYALTNRRLLVVTASTVESHGPEAFAHMQRRRVRGDRATIHFSSGAVNRRDGGPSYSSELVGVRNPGEVERLIRVTLKPALLQ